MVRRYDIVLIEGVEDPFETVIHQFTDMVNKDRKDTYDYELSKRIGSKKQFAFLYRSGVIKVVKRYHVNTNNNPVFDKVPPFSVLFKTVNTGKEFFLLAIHVKLAELKKETQALSYAFSKAAEYFSTSKGVIVRHLDSHETWQIDTQKHPLVKDPTFIWLQAYDYDTTVASRFIVHKSLESAVVEGNTVVFDTAVSNHEFQLQLAESDPPEAAGSDPPKAAGSDSLKAAESDPPVAAFFMSILLTIITGLGFLCCL
jgi:hypothetical protein